MNMQGEIHPAIMTLGRKYASGEVTGATARAVAMLVAFKHVVLDYSTPPDKVGQSFECCPLLLLVSMLVAFALSCFRPFF